jgi:methionyl-tRNA formyltransferase
MKTLSVIFVGTGEFGAKILSALASDKRIKIPFVVTGEDKPVGRNLKLTPNTIKLTGLLNNLIIHQPQRIEDLKDKIVQAQPDYLLVVAYGEIIKKGILQIPKHGSINIHGSLLPKHRGASPIQEAILNGDKTIGITWILMNEKMDAGDIVAQKEIPILPEDTYGSLSEKLSDLSAQFTGDVLCDFADINKSFPQNDKGATYCKKIEKKDGLIDPTKETAEQIERKIRGYNPWPGCFLQLDGKRLKITKAATTEQKIDAGKIEVINGTTLLIGTKKGTLIPLRVQPESKKEMDVGEFLRGRR